MTMYANPASMNAIAQTSSCFRLIMSIAIKMNDGMECMRKPPIWTQILSSPPNMSNQNIVRKRMKSIARILGARVRNLERWIVLGDFAMGNVKKIKIIILSDIFLSWIIQIHNLNLVLINFFESLFLIKYCPSCIQLVRFLFPAPCIFRELILML